MSENPSRKSDHSALGALGGLLADGDLGGLARRAHAALRGSPPPLHQGLRPQPRPSGQRLAPRSRDQPLVWMIGSSLDLTGAPISQFELATGLAAAGFVISVMAPSEGPLCRRYAGTGVDATAARELTCSASVPRWYERDIEALAKKFRDGNPDLIFANTIDAFPAVDAARLAGIPSLWNIRESEPWWNRLADRHTGIAARALAALAYPEAVIFVAKASLAAWSEFAPQAKSEVIYNAPHPSLLGSPLLDRRSLRARLNLPTDAWLVVSVGTLTARKGQMDLALAHARLPREAHSRNVVVFVGNADGPYAARLRQALNGGNAVFTGAVDNARDYIAAADVLVNTSRSEAFPRTFLEAAALRTPIVATAVDGATERLKHEHSAMMYSPGDDAALAVTLARLQHEPEMRQRLKAQAYSDLVEAWTFSEMLAAYAARLHEALA